MYMIRYITAKARPSSHPTHKRKTYSASRRRPLFFHTLFEETKRAKRQENLDWAYRIVTGKHGAPSSNSNRLEGEMRPHAHRPTLVDEKGLLVHEGSPAGDLLGAVDDARNRRDRDVAGSFQ
jgi:hypothetical protein